MAIQESSGELQLVALAAAQCRCLFSFNKLALTEQRPVITCEIGSSALTNHAVSTIL